MKLTQEQSKQISNVLASFCEKIDEPCGILFISKETVVSTFNNKPRGTEESLQMFSTSVHNLDQSLLKFDNQTL